MQYVMYSEEREKNRCDGLADSTSVYRAAVVVDRFIKMLSHGVCRCALTLTNRWARANVVYQFHFFWLHETMPHVLLRIVHSGHFFFLPAG